MIDQHINRIPEELGFTEVVGSRIINNLENNMNNRFDFIYSVRFWKLFLAGVSAGLATYSQSHDILLSISVGIGSWLTGSVAVGTIDRNADKKVEAATAAGTTTTVTMPANVDSVQASKDSTLGTPY